MLIDKKIIYGLLELLEHEYINRKKDSEKGVWRTIRGNKIFIREGETIKEAFERKLQYAKTQKDKIQEDLTKMDQEKNYQEILAKVKEDNEKDIDNNTLLKNAVENSYKPLDIKEVKAKVKEAAAYNNWIKSAGLETQKLYSDGNKNYTPEREKLHREILRDLFKNASSTVPSKGQKPTFIALGGRGGSGKSKFDGLVYDRKNYIVLDADAIKEKLPEYMGFNAFEVHEESSDILNMALDRARALGLNVVLDATMKSLGSTENKIKAFKDSDFNIEMYYMHLPRETASERAIGRFMGNRGRYVPLEVLQGMKNNEENFDKLKHYANKWAFYHNIVPNYKDNPVLVDKG